jgi:hypothetical protein
MSGTQEEKETHHRPGVKDEPEEGGVVQPHGSTGPASQRKTYRRMRAKPIAPAGPPSSATASADHPSSGLAPSGS